MGPKIKTVGVGYAVRINDQVVESKPTLREARQYTKAISLTDAVKRVDIIKVTTTEQLLDIYEPKQVTVLQASQLDEDLFDE